jgi:hypothetical protein
MMPDRILYYYKEFDETRRGWVDVDYLHWRRPECAVEPLVSKAVLYPKDHLRSPFRVEPTPAKGNGTQRWGQKSFPHSSRLTRRIWTPPR